MPNKAGGIKQPLLNKMIKIVNKVVSTISAVQLILTKNGHLYSIEDIELLNQCLAELEELKKEIAEMNPTQEIPVDRLMKVIRLLDAFFGTVNNIADYFNF